MATIEKSIEVRAPVRSVYNQWTQFEDFPRFMEGVESVHQQGDKHLHWEAKVGGKKQEWDAVISEQIPDKRVAWTSTSGDDNSGVVTFHFLSDDETRVTLQLTYDPDGIVETVGDKLGFMSRRVEGDLERFKEFIETRDGEATGAWRGEIAHRSDN